MVSVIIPVFENPEGIQALLEALASQTYPRDSFEVLVVDNGSRDATPATVAAFPPTAFSSLRLLEEKTVQGSYAARNKALGEAIGAVVAFTDADCRPVSQWLEAGVETLLAEKADLAGGRVSFTFAKENPNAAEKIDSRTNMQMEADILHRKITKTANLFVRKKVFEEIGFFNAGLRSGGDVEWTRKATTAGYLLVFASEAEILHPARSWRELFIKQIRVGQGQIMQKRGRSSLVGKKKGKTGRSLRSLLRVDDERLFGKIGILLALMVAGGGTVVGRFLGLLNKKRKPSVE
ncbi:MAG: glycosyltransferase family 2 protein [Opitutales bacterium]|nr:glycosyltransferase family 2 protein [Opitutales bacterium]